ncbi:hypothetical protein [Collimonas silvisoli]|uniref:hypothetical protein n=1 Tax=Collimonas silvisoli TaxID=2825884 RepID=UPI001B8B28B5|nr:hypothetical protein [Collimonas silvisoli]
MRSILFALVAFISVACQAADKPGILDCQAELTGLIVSNIKTEMNKKDISVELTENDNGVYKVRMFVAADNPNKQVSIGWVVLDTNKSSAYDITKDDEHPEKLNIDANKYKNFSEKCLKHVNKGGAQVIVDTKLPFVFDKYYQCVGGTGKADECGDRFHAYPDNTVRSELRNQIDSSMDTVLFMPSINDLKIILAGRAETDVNIYYLYVFRNNKLISKEMVGKMDGTSIVTFDISKNYLITTYERRGAMSSKVKNVNHFKLNENGGFIVCAKLNPECK